MFLKLLKVLFREEKMVLMNLWVLNYLLVKVGKFILFFVLVFVVKIGGRLWVLVIFCWNYGILWSVCYYICLVCFLKIWVRNVNLVFLFKFFFLFVGYGDILNLKIGDILIIWNYGIKMIVCWRFGNLYVINVSDDIVVYSFFLFML